MAAEIPVTGSDVTAFEDILLKGSQPKGEIKRKVATATETPVEEPVADAGEELDDVAAAALAQEAAEGEAAPEGEETELEAAEGEEAEETETEDEPADDQPATIQSVTDLAKWAGLEEGVFLDAITVADAAGNKVPLSAVMKAYNEAAASGTLASQLEARRAEVDGKLAQYEQERDGHYAMLQQTTNRLIKLADDEDASIDWKKLEAEDPQQYTYLKQKQAERTEAIRASVAIQLKERDRINGEQAKAKEKWIADEAQKLLKARPDLIPLPARQAATARVIQYMERHEFEPHIYGDILPDHRVFQLVEKAALWDELQGKGKLTLEKLQNAPKPKPKLAVKPRPQASTREPSKDAKATRTRTALQRLAKTGSEADAATYFREIL